MNLVTPSEMDSIDAETIEQHGLSSLVLMENAARSVMPHIPPGPVQILVGPGNNGGDGLVIARALQEMGRDVAVLLLAQSLSADAEVQKELAQSWGVPLQPHWSEDALTEDQDLFYGTVVIDALFGTGLSRPLSGRWARAVEQANRAPGFRLAIDIPSGIDGSTGQILGASFRADKTITFGRAKWGHTLFPGRERCGELVITQPGFHPLALSRHQRIQWVTPQSVVGLLPSVWPTMHKGDNGRILLVTGSSRYPGAGILSTLGALKGGGGLVTHAGSEEMLNTLMTWAPEALLARRDELTSLESYNALVIGSGLGEESKTLIGDLLERFSGPVVVDADALPLVRELPKERRASWILTPHPGELSRLLDQPVSELESDRIGNTLRAAEQLGCVVCFKGAPTVCASPDGRAYINSTGNPVLAQGGSGDVLAGVIGAFLGYGLPTLEAATGATYVHGLAADLLAQNGTPRGAGAHQIAELIPRAFGLSVGNVSPSGVH